MTQAWPLYVVTSANFFLAEKREKESEKKLKKKKKPPETLQLESPECVVDFLTGPGADLEGTVQCSLFFVKERQRSKPQERPLGCPRH